MIICFKAKFLYVPHYQIGIKQEIQCNQRNQNVKAEQWLTSIIVVWCRFYANCSLEEEADLKVLLIKAAETRFMVL